MTFYRVQDSDGRGPWKPGFSHQWVQDRPDHDNLPPWFVEFGRADQKALVGEHVGSACRTIEQLRRWFTPDEYEWLRGHGYNAVKVDGRVLAESEIQCLVACSRPLREHGGVVDLYPAEAAKGGE